MNSYFNFKQFTIHQDRCAQKVSEIACIFGAWINLKPTAASALDIGAGTGLLSLMLAQRYPQLQIDAIEIDPNTFLQLQQNMQSSPFANQLEPILANIKTIQQRTTYDCIVVNPPFHEKQLKSPDAIKNQAWHSAQLSLIDLIASISRLLHPSGNAFILLPKYRLDELEILLHRHQFFIQDILRIKHSSAHEEKILAISFSREKTSLVQTEFVVKENNQYTAQAKTLLSPYYLKL